MEMFRPLIADSVVINVVNSGIIRSDDFVSALDSVNLTADGRKKFLQAYERRVDTLVTHPVFAYRVSYRQVFEIQSRLLSRYLGGEFDTFPVFLTRWKVRSAYIVCYDISDEKRVKQMFKTMRRFGDHLQFSVFRCELNPMERVKMIGDLRDVMNMNEDQVLIIDIGPAPGRSDRCIESLGRPYTHPERHAKVIWYCVHW
jgi:CRISPR-associated endonuclease Cas2